MAKARSVGHAGWLLAIAVVTSAGGCVSMGSVSNSLSDLLVPSAAQPETLTGPRISVIIKKQQAAARVVEIPLAENMLLNDALKQTGAYREFRRPKIRLVRKDPHGGGEHALGAEYDRSAGRVPETSNYVLWDGDRVVVEQDEASNEIVDALIGPVGRLVTRR